MSESRETFDVINFLIERTENVTSPINIHQLASELKEKIGCSDSINSLRTRMTYFTQTELHKLEHIDMETKVKVLFGLSASLNPNFLKKLQKDAFVEVDEENRITKYKAKGGEMELEGDHCQSATAKTAQSGSKCVLQKLIRNYFNENKCGDDDTNNEYQKEITCLINFVKEECESVESPLNISKLITDFRSSSETSTSTAKLLRRINIYRQEIQQIEQLDTQSKVKQLFGLSATLSPDLLKELQKDAQVEVDGQNRIIKYVSNDGKMSFQGDHSRFIKMRSFWDARKKNKISATKFTDYQYNIIYESEEEELDSELEADEEHNSEENSLSVVTRSGRTSRRRTLDSSHNLSNSVKSKPSYSAKAEQRERSPDFDDSAVAKRKKRVDEIERESDTIYRSAEKALPTRNTFPRGPLVVECEADDRVIEIQHQTSSRVDNAPSFDYEYSEPPTIQQIEYDSPTMENVNVENSPKKGKIHPEEVAAPIAYPRDSQPIQEQKTISIKESNQTTNDVLIDSLTAQNKENDVVKTENPESSISGKESDQKDIVNNTPMTTKIDDAFSIEYDYSKHQNREIDSKNYKDRFNFDSDKKDNQFFNESLDLECDIPIQTYKRHVDNDSDKAGETEPGTNGTTEEKSIVITRIGNISIDDDISYDLANLNNSESSASPRICHSHSKGPEYPGSLIQEIGFESLSMRINDEAEFLIDKQPEEHPVSNPPAPPQSIQGSEKPHVAEIVNEDRIQLLESPNRDLGVPIQEQPEEGDYGRMELEEFPNTQIKVLGVMMSLIYKTKTPEFEEFQTEIKKQIEELIGINRVVSSTELSLAMNFCFHKMKSNSTVMLSENENSVGLKDFMFALQSTLIDWKISGLDDFLEKLGRCIEQEDLQDKRVSMEKANGILWTTIDMINS